MARPIQVEIDVKSQAAIGAFTGIATSVASAGLALVQAGISAGIEAIGNSIELASDKAEAASRINVLFGDSAGIITERSKEAATAVGLSSGAYLTAAGNVGNLLTNLGFAGTEAANMSGDIVQLSADMGSFNNLPTDQAVEAIGAAFRGESEPIRAFGVMLDDASIKAKALELGLYSGVGALDKNARATATYQLILEQTSNAQGDFAKTSDGLANSQRINAARLEDAWTKVGEKLAPIAQTILPMIADAIVGLVDGIGEVLDAIGDWAHDNQDLIDSLVEVGRVIFDALQTAFGWLIDVVGELGYRFGALIGLFIDLGGAIIDLGGAIVKVLQGDFEGAAADAERMVDRLGSFGENVLRVVGDEGQRMRDQVELDTRAAAEATIQASDDAEARTQEAWQRSAQMASAGADAIAKNAGIGTANGLSAALPPVERAAGDLGAALPSALEKSKKDAVDVASGTPGELAQALRQKRASWQDALSTLGDDLKNAMSEAQERGELEAALVGKRLARGLASTDPIVRAQAEATRDAITARLSELGGEAFDWGSKIGKGVANGLKSEVPTVRSYAALAARAIQDRLKLSSPAKEGPWSEDGGPIAWMERNGRRMREALGHGLAGPYDVPRLSGLSLAGAGAALGGGGITVNVYAGVGDPVEIGRQVREALRAYERASGTE